MTGSSSRCFGWELWSLALWWATWSLGDTYLLAYSPWAECCVLGVCVVVAVAFRENAMRNVRKVCKQGVQLATHHESDEPPVCTLDKV